MVTCRIYCDTPPETKPDSCESMKMQIVRMNTNSIKKINVKLFPPCGRASIVVPQGEMHFFRCGKSFADNYPSYKYVMPVRDKYELHLSVLRNGVVLYTSVNDVELIGLSVVTIPAIETEGYYTGVLSFFDGESTSRCLFKIFVC